MPFICAELVIESVIRDGIANMVNNPEIIDRLFASLNYPYNQKKYGIAEINKIKNLILKKQIAVVHNLSDIGATTPCYSIQLGEDVEKGREAMIGDFSDILDEEITDPEELADLERTDPLVPLSYDPNSGIILISPGADLSQVTKGNLFVDASNNEFTINLIVKDLNAPQIIIEKNQVVDITDFCSVKSAINFHRYEEKNIVSDVKLIIGVHAKNALDAKYLYIMLKYIMVSRKTSLIKRNFLISTFSGSDFSRNMQYQGDHVYNRFFTISGRIDDSWRADEVDIVDNIDVIVKVPIDVATNDDLDLNDSTVQVSDD